MFKYKLEQTVFYLRSNRIHSAPILCRKYVENLNNYEFKRTLENRYDHNLPFGSNCIRYMTCHGVFHENEVFESKEDFILSLMKEYDENDE